MYAHWMMLPEPSLISVDGSLTGLGTSELRSSPNGPMPSGIVLTTVLSVGDPGKPSIMERVLEIELPTYTLLVFGLTTTENGPRPTWGSAITAFIEPSITETEAETVWVT